ncbi:tetratricopeptide repeat family protein [Calothrix parasitica NIES-267]|uniref:Tetratricopeptide repeat family protein n=1 Tax=Calothrix parasitica NIES-267 TaxID=1973488 RepID=A0A1Z4LWG6_9CYAN|nr:tetratricopeptide repeat family protein [Calothrix parasitica NIES-267]
MNRKFNDQFQSNCYLNFFYKANLWERKQRQSKAILELTLLPFHLFVFTCPIVLATLNHIDPVLAQNASGATQKGYNLLKKGWVDDAIKEFKKALQANPQSLQAKLGLAIAYNRTGDIDKAFQTYQEVLQIDPQNQAALRIVGMMGTYKPEWNKPGIDALNILLELSPGDVQSRYYRALLFSYQGQFSKSIADFEIVLANNPTPEAIIGAAQTYSYSGDYQKASELFNRYKATGKQITDYAAVAYALTLRKTGNPQQAISILKSQLQRSEELDELAILTRAELSQAYIANKQEAEALAVLQPLEGREDAILPLARALNEIRKNTDNPGLADRVANLYRQALANKPNPSSNLLREIANVFTGLPEGEETALQIYRRLAVQLPSDRSLVVRQLGLEYKLGMISKAYLNQRLVTNLQDFPRETGELKELGLALADIDSPSPQLLTAYQNMLQAGVNVPFLNFRVAQMYLQLENTIQARQALANYTATNEGANDMATQLLAAEIERREGNLEASAQRYFAILNENPQSDITDGALRGLVGVRVQQKRFDEALVVYDQLLKRNPNDITAQLGQTSVAYQAKRISKPQAEAVLDNWLATQKATNTPPELYSLVTQLPTDPNREALYNYLVEVDPSSIRLQQRLLESIALRSPGEARLRMKQLIANSPNDAKSQQRVALLAKAIGDLEMASEAYENILKEEPDDIDALAALGGIRFEQRRFESAEQIYSTVLEQNPQDTEARRALAGLNTIFDRPIAAMKALEQLQIEQIATGEQDPEISTQMQQIQEDFLQRRGFQPPWESYERRGKR